MSTPTPLTTYLSTLPELSKPRVQFLYSAFSSRKQSNPIGYSGALTWWKSQLTIITRLGIAGDEGDKLVLRVDEEFREGLRWEGVGRPASLGTVVTELINDGTLQSLNSYLTSSPSTITSSSSSSSYLSIITRPIGWVASRIIGTSDSASSGLNTAVLDEGLEWGRRQGDYVHLSLVEKAANTILPHLQTHCIDTITRLMTTQDFKTRFAIQAFPRANSTADKKEGVDDEGLEKNSVSELDNKVLIKWFCDKGYCVKKGEALKFRPFNELSTTKSEPLIITTQDQSILSLLSTQSSLQTSIDSLTSRIAQTRQLALTSLSLKQSPTLTKSHLLSKKHLETLLSQRISSKEKIDQILLSIETSSSSIDTLTAMELGSHVLKEILKDPKLELGNVDKVNEGVREALEDAEELERVIREGGERLGDEDEREVEEELRKLTLQEDREKEEKLKDTGKVPSGGIGEPTQEKEREKIAA